MKRTYKIPSTLSDSLHHRLNAYAFAASAAGVSLLALAQPAEAKIVYTPAHVTFGGGPCGSFGGKYYLDVNHDGIADFVFDWSGLGSRCTSGPIDLLVQPTSSNGVAGPYNWASRLGSGALIGPRQSFSGSLMAWIFFWGTGVRLNQCRGEGNWYYYCPNGSEQGYLGLKFSIHGQTHYGWARLNVFTNWNAPALITTLLGYAYETIPAKPIIAGRKHAADAKQSSPASLSAPEPASLGRLAQGAPGVAAWRGKELTGAMTK
jgi:hypothetical protein